jgi:hypothetical protein
MAVCHIGVQMHTVGFAIISNTISEFANGKYQGISNEFSAAQGECWPASGQLS